MTHCPIRAQLERYLRRDLGELELETCSSHIENCTSCQLVLDELTHGSIVARLRAMEWPETGEEAAHTANIKAQETTTLAREPREVVSDNRVREDDHAQEAGATTGDFPRSEGKPLYFPAIAGFQIIREIGRGGMGVVYEAEQQSLSRHVALKVLETSAMISPKRGQRFDREAKAAGRLHHTNIVPVFGVGIHDRYHYFVMQYIEGVGLNAVLDELRRLRREKMTPRQRASDQPRAAADGKWPEPTPGPEIGKRFSPSLSEVARSLATGRFAEPGPHSVDRPATEPLATVTAILPSPIAAASRAPAGPSWLVLPGSSRVSSHSDPERTYFQSVARIGLQVAEALEYAHRQGVLHRDIKPSNLLLDTQETVWVADFGLAKMEGDDDLTDTGDVVGTLRYTAPERFRSHCDARSDVYSLGLSLYELVALRPAYDASDRHELMERVLHEEPVSLKTLAPRVPRDLETIITKAAAREPARRYATAGALAEDLRRFLDGQTILARRAGVPERFWSWCRRNPRVATLSVAVFSSLAAGTIVSSVLALRATRAEGAATRSEAATRQQWVRAESEAAKAKQSEARSRRSESEARAMLGFFQIKVLAAARPKDQEGGLGIDATVRDALDAAESSVEKSFAGQPMVEASIRAALGETYRILGEPALAIRQMERSRELSSKIADHADPDALGNLSNLAMAYLDAGRVSDAISLAVLTLGRMEAELGADHPMTLQCRNNLGIAYENAGRLPEAIALQETTIKLMEAAMGPDHADTLIARANLAVAYENVGRVPEAIALHKSTLKLHEAKLGPDHPDTLLSRTSLASALGSAGRIAEVIELLEETLKMQEAKIGPNHNHTLVTRTILANAYLAVGRTIEAIELHKTTLKVRESTLGADNPFTIMSQNNLAVAYLDAGRCHEAIFLHEAAAKAREAALGSEHPHTLLTRNNLARAYESVGRLVDAERLRRETLTRRRKSDKPDSPQLAGDLAGLGSNMIAQSRWVEAQAVLRECLEIREKAMPEDWKRYEAMCLLGASLLYQRQYAASAELLIPGYEGMWDRRTSIPFRDRPALLAAGERIIRLYGDWEKPEKAAVWKAKLGLPDLPGDVFLPR